MKIIAKTSGGYIVEMTADEIAKAGGYGTAYGSEWEKALTAVGEYSIRNGPPIGMKIDVKAAYDFHARIDAHEAEAKKSAGTLRALADLMDGARPSVVIPLTRDTGASEDGVA